MSPREYLERTLDHGYLCRVYRRPGTKLRHEDCDCPRREVLARWDEMVEVLREVDEWDLQWADGLDANVERIKSRVREVLDGS